MIETRDLSWSIGRHSRLEGLTISVAEGEVVGLLGPIHSGKSTALKLLATLIAPTGGSASVAGHDLVGEPEEIRRRVGYLPFFMGLYDDMRVSEYIEFFARCAQVDPERVLDRLLGLADLADRADEYVDGLDREARQRLGLVRTLVHDPPVLLLDHPSIGLDLPACLRMRELIGRVRGMGKTILACSNMMTDLVGLCDRIGVLHEGRLVALGAAGEIAGRLGGGRLLELELAGPAADIAAQARRHPAVLEADAEEQYLLLSLDGRVVNPLEVVRQITEGVAEVVRLREHQVDARPLLRPIEAES
ncbi:MAG: ABC transporter ATP-binding protein [Candidatus Sumerlaeia bacterium]